MKAGFIGFGAMGYPMASICTRRACSPPSITAARESPALARETGCSAAGSIAELAGLCDAVVLCVTADADVLAVVDVLLEISSKVRWCLTAPP